MDKANNAPQRRGYGQVLLSGLVLVTLVPVVALALATASLYVRATGRK